MTGLQWATLGLGFLGFLLTWTGMVVGGTWALGKLNKDISDKIAAEKHDVATKFAAESSARAKALADAVYARDVELDVIRKEFGETGHALRRYMEGIEKEMHTIEIWNRDNYVQKGEFERAIDSIRSDIRALSSEIKIDFKELKAELLNKN